MLAQLKHLLLGRRNRPIFILGTGRSGTHWLGETLAPHPEIRATIEGRPIFNWVRDMAINPSLRPELMPRLLRAYRRELRRSAPRHYLDKSHPNLWLAEELRAAFPDARFLGIERNPFATVASMMQHKAVADWHLRWRQFPVPNLFLGIDETTAETYDRLSLAAQCALRWRSHHQRMEFLRSELGNRLLVIQYEGFAADPAGEMARVQEFLGLREPVAVPEVSVESLSKWKAQLSPVEIAHISKIVGFTPHEMPRTPTVAATFGGP